MQRNQVGADSQGDIEPGGMGEGVVVAVAHTLSLPPSAAVTPRPWRPGTSPAGLARESQMRMHGIWHLASVALSAFASGMLPRL